MSAKAQEVTRHSASMGRVAVFAIVCVLLQPMSTSRAASQATIAAAPTAENALAADEDLARAIRENDANGIRRMLDDSWVVIATTGGIGEGPSVFPDGIKSGYLTRKTFELSEPRVRLYGDVAVVTTKVKTSGVLQGKPFDVVERQTDVLHWANGSWKCILTHETKIANN
jgi:ketosteroid isomerase-like protein